MSCGIALEGEVLAAETLPLHGAGDGETDVIDQPRAFANVIGRAAGFDSLDRGFVVIDGRDENDGRIRRNLVGVLQYLNAIRLRHTDVSDNHVVKRGIDLGLGGFSGIHGLDAVAFAAQSNVEEFADGALVVGYENVTHEHLLRQSQFRQKQFRQNRRRRNGTPCLPQCLRRPRARPPSGLRSTEG